MEKISFSGESEIVFSETELKAAEQLMQLSEEDSMSCNSGTSWSVEGNTKRQEAVVSSKVRDMVRKEQYDDIFRNKNVMDDEEQCFMKAITETKTRINKKQKFRSLARIYKATKEMTKV